MSSKTSTSGCRSASSVAHVCAAQAISDADCSPPPTASSTPDASAEQIGHRLVATAVPELLVGGFDGVVVGDAGGHLHHLGDGPVRDALPVGQAAAREDRRALDAVDELAREARLADARRAEDRHEVHAVVPDDARERVVEQLDLLLAPDERHRDDEPAPDVLGDRDHAPCLDPVREAARLLRAERRRDDDPAREPLDGRAEHDLARLAQPAAGGRPR